MKTEAEISKMSHREKDLYFCTLCKGRVRITDDERIYQKVFDKRCYDCEKEYYQP